MSEPVSPRFIFQDLPASLRSVLEPNPSDLQRRWADLVRLVSDVVFEADRHLTLTFVSARAADVLGLQPWEMIGRPLSGFGRFVQGGTDAAEPDWRHPVRDREFLASARDGTARHLLINAVPVFDQDSEGFVGIRATAEDRTRRREDQDRLRKLSMAVEQSPASVIITNANGIIEYVNRRFVEMSGYAPEDALGRTPSILNSGRMARSMYRDMWQTINAGKEWRGEVYNRRKSGEGLWEYVVISPIFDEAGRITHFVGVQEDVSERKRFEEAQIKKGNTDEVTGLPNRLLLLDRLEQALTRAERHSTCGGMVVVNLDNFQRINNVLGHFVADKILAEAGNRLAALVRPEDTVARLGGDEFAIVVCECKPADIESLAQRIMRGFAQPFTSAGREVFITPSAGLTIFPDDAADAADLMRNADSATRRVKDMGGNGFQFFTPDMNDRARERARLEAGLCNALGRGELQMHYQAMIDTQNGLVVGAEALMRWNSPEFGRVPPDQFIPLAESSELIVHLGSWALETACAQAAAWREEFGPTFRMAVNVSTRQLRQSGFAAEVLRITEAVGFPRDNLELEITESLLMEGTEALDELALLRDAGIALSIDDFGTGYSSLSYLKRLPVCTLKIDRSFVRDLAGGGTDATLVKTIIVMAHALGLGVVAEGVETLGQLEALKALGCDVTQGFLFGAAVSPASFGEALPPGAAAR
ncbi:MAG TPA: EAL domain-containing protein [Rhodospirillaceae bacterium]|nr:EAL domain-containing protein [Rhodospirillaceae bacterium]